METTWILVANRGGASLFERTSKDDIRRVKDISHAQGRLKNQDIDTDKAARSFDRFGPGRHATGAEHEPTEHIAEQFAKSLADMLDQGRIEHVYTRLILVAGPEFLGRLLKTLDANTAAIVTKTIDKNLPDINEQDLAGYLDGA
ncbi:MAG: host attachment protein [Gammaproteobacteria bacterium]